MKTPIPQSDLISNGRCIILYASLAQKIGLNEAIVVQQLHFLLGLPGGKEIAGEHWIFNTYEQWQTEHFPWWSERTIRRTFDSLETMLIVQSCQPDGVMSRKKYYKLNTGIWVKLIKGTLPFPSDSDVDKLAASNSPKWPHPQQSLLNRETKESKETSPAGDVVIHPEWKPDKRTKEQKLSRIRIPQDYPSQQEFDKFIEDHADHVSAYRADLYGELCLHKWHHWNPSANRWVTIRDWKAYVAALDDKISSAND